MNGIIYQRIWQPRSCQREVTSLKYVVSQIKREIIEKSSTHRSQQCNPLNDQQLYQPRTCPLNNRNFYTS